MQRLNHDLLPWHVEDAPRLRVHHRFGPARVSNAHFYDSHLTRCCMSGCLLRVAPWQKSVMGGSENHSADRV
jgi:hypothetical protein